jgi:hypothetical protein
MEFLVGVKPLEEMLAWAALPGWSSRGWKARWVVGNARKKPSRAGSGSVRGADFDAEAARFGGGRLGQASQRLDYRVAVCGQREGSDEIPVCGLESWVCLEISGNPLRVERFAILRGPLATALPGGKTSPHTSA